MSTLTEYRVPVTLALLSSEQGGRREPVRSGYRPSFWLGTVGTHGKELHDARVNILGAETLEPGGLCDAELVPSVNDAWQSVEDGQSLAFYEGARCVGVATRHASNPDDNGLHEIIRSMDPASFELLAAALISKTEGIQLRELLKEDGLDLVVRSGSATTLYQIKSRSTRPLPSSHLLSLLRQSQHATRFYFVTADAPTVSAYDSLEEIAERLGLVVAWYTAEWVAERLRASPDVQDYFLRGGRQFVWQRLRDLSDTLTHGSIEQNDAVTFLEEINRRSPFLEWTLISLRHHGGRPLIGVEKYPGARLVGEIDSGEASVTSYGDASSRIGRHSLSLAKILDKTYEDKDLSEIADAPVTALQGVSESDAEHLKAAFGISTIRELATNRYVLWAQAINVLAK